SFVASTTPASRRRRGPVALCPRLSPGWPLSLQALLARRVRYRGGRQASRSVHVAPCTQRRLEHPLPAQPLRRHAIGNAEVAPGVVARRSERQLRPIVPVPLPILARPRDHERAESGQRAPVTRRVATVSGEQPAIARHAPVAVGGGAPPQTPLELVLERRRELPRQ